MFLNWKKNSIPLTVPLRQYIMYVNRDMVDKNRNALIFEKLNCAHLP
jgi:hypothetical protein